MTRHTRSGDAERTDIDLALFGALGDLSRRKLFPALLARARILL